MFLGIGGETVDVLDRNCPYRACYGLLLDRGSFTAGLGYTGSHRQPQWVCRTRHLSGCPDPLPDVDPKRRERILERERERVRCCHAPRVRANPSARRQKCLTCGSWLAGTTLAVVREGQLHAKFACRHAAAQECMLPGWWECQECSGYWEHRPEPWDAPKRSFADLLAELRRRIVAATA